MKNVLIKDLKYTNELDNNYYKYQDGYRIVYFYPDDTYKVGEYCNSVKEFMIGFVEYDSIIDNDDIQSSFQVKDFLSRYLSEIKNVVAVRICKTDSIYIQIQEKQNKI